MNPIAVPYTNSLTEGGRIVITRAERLPTRSHRLTRLPSEYLTAPLKELEPLGAQLEADLLADLERYDIQDPASLRDKYNALSTLAQLRTDWAAVPDWTARARALESKPGSRHGSGVMTDLMALCRQHGRDAAWLCAQVQQCFGAMPWSDVGEIVKAAKGSIETYNPALMVGTFQSQLDPVARNADGAVPESVVLSIVAARVQMELLGEFKTALVDALQAVVNDNRQASREDIWTPRTFAIAPDAAATPVVIGVWDSGVDLSLFAQAPERGIGFDDDGQPAQDLLLPLGEAAPRWPQMVRLLKGAMDQKAALDTEDARQYRITLAALEPGEVKAFHEDMGLASLHVHGTHVAGIAVDGNPFARVFTATMLLSHKVEPKLPSEARSRATAASYTATVAALRRAGARVVNMSWRIGPKMHEDALAFHNAGGSAQERRQEALRLFRIESDALEAAIAQAPEILFVAGSGNEDNSADFQSYIPAGFSLPNLITVGAVDHAGAETSFSSFGETVVVHANGFEVDSFLPGGDRMKFSGTSMASPQVANLAAKLLALDPSLTPIEVKDLILECAERLPGSDGQPGRVNLVHPRNSAARSPRFVHASAETTMQRRYRRAEARSQLVANELVLNTQVVPHWIARTDSFWYEWQTPRGREFRRSDPRSGSNQPAFDHAMLARALQTAAACKAPPDAHDLPLAGLELSADGGEVRFDAYSRRWRYDASNDVCSEGTDPSKRPAPGVRSPDGARIAFVRDHNVWVHHVADGAEKALTTDGERFCTYGLEPEGRRTDIGRPAMPGSPQIVWSPDSRRVLTVHLDERKVRSHTFVEHVPGDGSVHPRTRDTRWATPGDEHVAAATFIAIEVESGRITRARYAPVPAVRMLDAMVGVGLAWFSDDGGTAYFVDVERAEQAANVVAFDTASGRARVLFSEETTGYLELGTSVYARTSVHALPKRNELIWYSERTGQAHLYRYDLATGALKNAITAGDFRVCDVVRVDEARGEVWFTASNWPGMSDPYYRVLCRVSLEGGEPVLLTREDADHDVLSESDFAVMALKMSGTTSDDVSGVSPSGNFFVETFGRIDGPPESVLRDRDGRIVLELATADFSRVDAWRWPEPFSVLAADGQTVLHGILVRPSDFDPAHRYPVLDYIYGGPQVSHVPKAALRSMLDKANLCEALSLAELGFIVMLLDGRGTAMRDRSFQQHSHGAVQRASDIDDHAAAIRQLAECHPQIDAQRVGIIGFSGGGFATAGAMLRRPDVFKVGVASSGNYDQRLFWHSWGERYHGLLDGDNYESQSLKAMAEQLQGKLMFTHGMLDAGCPVSALFQLTDALAAANKDFEMVLDAQLGHERSSYATRRAWDFLVRHLAGEVPPENMRIKLGGELMKDKALARSRAAAGTEDA